MSAAEADPIMVALTTAATKNFFIVIPGGHLPQI